MTNDSILICRRRPRTGYMLLVCTLAASVLGMASVAILRSTQQRIRWVDAQRTSVQGRMTAEALYQRAVATLRDNPKAQGTIIDPATNTSGAYAVLQSVGKNQTRVDVFLYQRSSVPAISHVIDTEAISGKGKGKGNGKGKEKTNGKGKGK